MRVIAFLLMILFVTSCSVNNNQKQSDKSDVVTETEKAQATQYGFRTSVLWEDHFSKHGAELGKITKEQYLQMANDLINSKSKSVLTKYEDDGDKLFYDVNKNEFLVLSTDGYIRTFFKPDDGLDYYNKQ